MANSLAGLVIQLGLDASEYFSGMTKAELQAKQSAERMQRSLEGIRNKFLAIGSTIAAGFGVNAFADMILGSIKAQEEIGLVGARAGLSGEDLSKFAGAARRSHTDLVDVAQMSARFSKALISNQEEGGKVRAVLDALGISAKDTARFLGDPTQAIFELAKKINELPESGTKAAIQLLLIGRAGGTTSAFLRDLSKQSELTATQFQKNIEAATEFEHQLVALSMNSDATKRALANALLPTLSDVVKAFYDLVTGAGGAKGAIAELTAQGKIREWAESAALGIAAVIDSFLVLGQTITRVGRNVELLVTDAAIAKGGLETLSVHLLGGDPAVLNKSLDDLQKSKDRRAKILADMAADNEKFFDDLATPATDALTKQFAASAASRQAVENFPKNADFNDRLAARNNDRDAAAAAKAAKEKERRLQQLVKTSGAGATDDPAKKILEGRLKAQEALIEEEKQMLNAREQFLSAYYEHGDISLDEYFKKRQESLLEGLNVARNAYAQEIADLEAFKARSGTSQVDRADADNKVLEVRKKLQLVEQTAATESVKAWFVQQLAAEQYRQTLVELSAKLLDLQGNTAEATRIRQASQNIEPRRKFTAAGDTVALSQLDAVERITNAQAQLTQATTRYGNELTAIGVIQGRIDVQLAVGNITTLDALRLRSEVTSQYVESLRQQLAATEELAAQTGRKEDILHVQQLRNELELLAATGDLVAKKFQDVFAGSFEEAINAAIEGGKSLNDILKSLEKSLVAGIGRIASQNISESLFKTGGLLSGIGDFFSQTVGFGKAQPGDAATVGLTGAAAQSTSALTALTGAAAADAALLTVSTSAVTSSASLAALTAAATTAAAALASVAASSAASGVASGLGAVGGGVGSSIGSALTGLFGFASGTPFAPGGLALVGERGPELVNLPRGARVIPNDELQARRESKKQTSVSLNQVINVLPGASTKTATQAAAEVALQANRAMRNL